MSTVRWCRYRALVAADFVRSRQNENDLHKQADVVRFPPASARFARTRTLAKACPSKKEQDMDWTGPPVGAKPLAGSEAGGEESWLSEPIVDQTARTRCVGGRAVMSGTGPLRLCVSASLCFFRVGFLA